jgi:hypothetical protein
VLRGVMDMVAERRAKRLFDRATRGPAGVSAKNWISAESSKVVADRAM